MDESVRLYEEPTQAHCLQKMKALRRFTEKIANRLEEF